MGRIFLLLVGLVAVSGQLVSPAWSEMRMWVAINGMKRYTCPSVECGVVGRFFFRESLRIHETREGWSRVSVYKSAGCYEGKSAYVEAGPEECSPENGIVQGDFAEWVQSEFLSEQRPEQPAPAQG